MNLKKIYTTLSLAFFTLSSLFTPGSAIAASTKCYDITGTDTSVPSTLGGYIECAIPKVWGAFQLVIVAIAILMVMFLIYKTVTNMNNPKELETLPRRWMYVIILGFLAIGAGGTILNFIFKLIGLGSLGDWFAPLNNLLQKLITLENNT